MSDSINLPKGTVESIVGAHIRATVFEALAKSPEALVKAVVDQALREQRDRYSGKSVFEEAVSEMIRKTAGEVFQEWLTEQRPLIAKQIRAKFDGSSKKLVDTIAEKLVGHLGGMFHVNVSISEKGDF